MIIAKFDNGWGDDVPLKQWQNQLLKQYLDPIYKDNVPTVLIESVWYTSEFHERILPEIQKSGAQRLILTALLDAPIPKPEWYQTLDCPVIGVGYYPGPFEIDAWAMIVDQNMQLTDVGYENIDTPFMCLNRKPHYHRTRLFQDISKRGLLDKGFVTMGGDNGTPIRSLPEDDNISLIAPNPGKHQYGINNDLTTLGNRVRWQRHFLNVVTETVFDISKQWFVSEKIYKPILGERPFLICATDGGLKWLKTHGFEDYTQDFSDITDLDLSQHYNIAPFLETLCSCPRSYLLSKYLDLRSKIQYNKEQFSRHVATYHQRIQQGIQCQI